jgi:hypothetical protein
VRDDTVVPNTVTVQCSHCLSVLPNYYNGRGAEEGVMGEKGGGRIEGKGKVKVKHEKVNKDSGKCLASK